MTSPHRHDPWRRRRLRELAKRLSIRGAGVRGKVTLALFAVVALLIPQITLTVMYMVDFFAAGERLGALAESKNALEGVDRAIRAVVTEPLIFVSAGDGPDQRTRWSAVTSALGKLSRASLGTDHANLAKSLGHAAQALELAWDEELARFAKEAPPELASTTEIERAARRQDGEARQWRLDHPDPSLPQTLQRVERLEMHLVGQAVSFLGAVATDTWALNRYFESHDDARARIKGFKSRLLASIHTLRTALSTQVGSVGDEIRRKVDAANRYLITLVLLTLVYVGLVILLLPGRLVAPLKHLESVMNAAGRGRFDVQARVIGDDEMGRTSAAFNRMLDRLAITDDLKRDRIYEDRQRIDLLSDRIDRPLAILDTRTRIEHANGMFARLFGLQPGYHGTSLADLLEGADQDRFLDAIDRSMRGRDVGTVSIALASTEGGADAAPRPFAVTLEPGRGRNGTVSFVVIALAPGPRGK